MNVQEVRATSTTKRLIRLAAVGGLLVALVLAGRYARDALLPKRFAVMEAGQLFRSGYCEPWPLERLVDQHHFKTVLTLLSDEPDTSRQQNENAVLARKNVKLIRIPMPGDGCADFNDMDTAAAVIANPANRPILVHCEAGVNRTGAAYAAYRMKYCGWSDADAIAESEKYGYSHNATPKLREHLQRYYQNLNASSRPAIK